MMRLRSGEFSHLVVWKIDRISRNLIDFATMYEAKSGGAPGMI
jgi:DNA invertase Pin-like site-specific DNA recombinase